MIGSGEASRSPGAPACDLRSKGHACRAASVTFRLCFYGEVLRVLSDEGAQFSFAGRAIQRIAQGYPGRKRQPWCFRRSEYLNSTLPHYRRGSLSG